MFIPSHILYIAETYRDWFVVWVIRPRQGIGPMATGRPANTTAIARVTVVRTRPDFVDPGITVSAGTQYLNGA